MSAISLASRRLQGLIDANNHTDIPAVERLIYEAARSTNKYDYYGDEKYTSRDAEVFAGCYTFLRRGESVSSEIKIGGNARECRTAEEYEEVLKTLLERAPMAIAMSGRRRYSRLVVKLEAPGTTRTAARLKIGTRTSIPHWRLIFEFCA